MPCFPLRLRFFSIHHDNHHGKETILTVSCELSSKLTYLLGEISYICKNRNTATYFFCFLEIAVSPPSVNTVWINAVCVCLSVWSKIYFSVHLLVQPHGLNCTTTSVSFGLPVLCTSDLFSTFISAIHTPAAEKLNVSCISIHMYWIFFASSWLPSLHRHIP